MSRRVRVNAGHKRVMLPDGKQYDGPIEVVLSDAEFGRISSGTFSSGVVTDLGDEVVDSDPVTHIELLENGSSGRLLDEVESTIAQTGVTAITDLTSLVIEFEVTDRPVLVTLELPWLTQTVAGIAVFAFITDEANAITRQAGQGSNLATGVSSVSFSERIDTPGSYTRKGRFQRYGASGSVGNNADLAYIVSRLAAVEQ